MNEENKTKENEKVKTEKIDNKSEEVQKTEENKPKEIQEDKKTLKKEKKHKKEKHEDKLNEAFNKISELEDKLLREKAEMINLNKRRDDEMHRMLKYCNEDLIKDILPTIDNLERAIQMTKEDESNKKLLEGVKMVYCNLINTLEKYEVKIIDGNNKPFDPTYHEAVLTEHVEDKEVGLVLEVLQKGYLYKERVIRPAMVKVNE